MGIRVEIERKRNRGKENIKIYVCAEMDSYVEGYVLRDEEGIEALRELVEWIEIKRGR